MALYVIKNLDVDKYLAIVSPAHIAGGSYTERLEEARTFSKRSIAEEAACKGERVFLVTELLMPPVDL